jgi:hypothetical protein
VCSVWFSQQTATVFLNSINRLVSVAETKGTQDAFSVQEKPNSLTFLVVLPLIPRIGIPRPLSQSAAYNHANISIFTLPLAGRQTGEAWEPFYKKNFLLLPQQIFSHFSHYICDCRRGKMKKETIEVLTQYYLDRLKKKKLHGLSPRANYTDRANAACRRSDCQLLRIKGATWSA